MKDEKDFDNAVKAKLESRVYVPDENSWAAAEKLILEQEAAGRSGSGKYFLGLFAAIGVLAVTGWFLLYSPQNNSSTGNKTAAVAASRNETQNNTGNNTASAGTAANSSNASSAESGNDTRPNGQINAPQNMNSTPGQGLPATTAAKNSSETQNAPAKPHNKTTTANSGNKNGGTPADTTPKKRNNKKTAPGKTAGAAASANTTALAEAQTPSETSAENEIRTSGSLSSRTTMQPGAGNGNSSSDALASSTAIKDSSIETIAAKPFIAVTTQETNDQESLSGSVKTNGSNTSTSTVVPSNGQWFVQGGIAFMPGFESSTTVGRSINPVLGGGYSYSFGKQFRIEGGLQYTTIGKAADSSRIYTSQNFSFGLEQERTEIGLQRLHYVAMPIQLRIALGEKNALLAGVTPHYLFTAESRVRTYTLSHNSITNDKTTRQFGYSQGLRTTDLLLGAGYARRISDRLDVSAQFNFGLFDIKDNAYFGFEKTERHKNLQLLLRYKF